MSSLERRLAAVTNRAADLSHRLRELYKLRDRVRQAELSAQKCEKMRKVCGKPAETERNEATLADTPRACLFREAKPALLALGISDSRTGGLIVQWLS